MIWSRSDVQLQLHGCNKTNRLQVLLVRVRFSFQVQFPKAQLNPRPHLLYRQRNNRRNSCQDACGIRSFGRFSQRSAIARRRCDNLNWNGVRPHHQTQGLQKPLETNAAKPFKGLGCFFLNRSICPQRADSASVWSQHSHNLTALLPPVSSKGGRHV